MSHTRKKRTRCPNGFRKVKGIGCMPKGTKQIKKKRRTRCPNGQRKNPKTGKCVSKTVKRKVIRLPKTMKRRVVVKVKKKRKRCPNGMRRNPKTGECEFKTMRKTKEETKDIIPDNTPSTNKSLRANIANFGLYSPSINKMLVSLKTKSPVGVKGADCSSELVNVTLKNGKKRCLGWNSKAAQKIMLGNLRSKKPITCSTVTAPKQAQSNCWFNAFFMTFFISDMGRKFNRWLREAMITGKLADGRVIAKKLRKPLFALNKYINASLRSSYDDTNFADLMDTNYIIKNIYSAIGRRINRAENETIIAPVDSASNPLTFYKGLYQTLGGDLMHWITISISNPSVKILSDIQNEFKKYDKEAFAKVIYLEIYDNASKTFHKPKKFVIKRRESDGLYSFTYTLDSAVLRNTSKIHFSAYITCNGKDYGFDGESFSRMQSFKWKSKLNLNSKWRFAEQYETYFNFTKGYQLLVYYLTDKRRISE